MRLNRLELIRYGQFQNAEIEFPARADDGPDVTIVFGPNEAGKSTAFNGFLELLFGIKMGRHPYAFRFDRSDLLVGAEIVLPGQGTVVLRRNSKKAQSLVDANGRPLDPALLSSALHGLSREAYLERFSLNETGLRQGGERIAKAQGDLGQLLYAGLSGLTGMTGTLDALQERADSFYKKGGRSSGVKQSKLRLKDIRTELRKYRLTPDVERNLQQNSEQSARIFKEADIVLQKVRSRQAAANAAQVWYELSQDMEQVEKLLSNFPKGPNIAQDALENVVSLSGTIDVNTQQIKELANEIKKQAQIIQDNPLNSLIQPLSAELDRFAELSINDELINDRAATALTDVKLIAQQRDELSEQINTVLHDLQLSNDTKSTIALNTIDPEELDASVRECLIGEQNVKSIRQQIKLARKQLGNSPPEPRDLSTLRTMFEEWDKVKDLAAAQSEHSRCESSLSALTASLPATWRQFVADGLPAPETIDEINKEYLALKAAREAAERTMSASKAELVEAMAEFSSLESAPDSVDIDETEKSRRSRDQQWQNHRVALTTKTADGFEQAMYADDINREHYLNGLGARQRLQAARVSLTKLESRFANDEAIADELGEQLKSIKQRSQAIARALGLEDIAPPASFIKRRRDLDNAAQAAAALGNAKQLLDTGLERQQSAYDKLIEAARSSGFAANDEDLFLMVHRALITEHSDRKLWDKWQNDEKEVNELVKELNRAEEKHADALNRVNILTTGLLFSGLSPVELQKRIPQLRHFKHLHTERAALSNKLDTLKQITTATADTARRLVQILGSTDQVENADPLVIIGNVRDQFKDLQLAEEIREEAIIKRDLAVKKSQQLSEKLLLAQSRLDAFFTGQGDASLPSRERVSRLTERDKLRAQQARAENERRKVRKAVDESLFIDELERLPDATREAVLEQDLTDAQQLRDTAFAEMKECERIHKDAFNATERSDLSTEEATLLEGLRRDAHQAVVARVGVLAARGALRRLAKEKRSDMLRDVANAFVMMTTPVWKDVNVWSQSEGDKLVGIKQDGKAVPVEHMSTGTMGQLYFALRLAGYQSFARQSGALPMILDDIMETFDDTRAVAALKLCSEIGKSGQAILFTHHAHLVKLARDTVGNVAVVSIPE